MISEFYSSSLKVIRIIRKLLPCKALMLLGILLSFFLVGLVKKFFFCFLDWVDVLIFLNIQILVKKQIV